jgi:hypothetical protein
MNAISKLISLSVLPLTLFLATPAVAAEPSIDVEVDPMAFVLDGYSLHAGVGWNHFRLDLGAFAMAMPHAFHGQDGFAPSFDGFGAKLQFFPFAEQTGGFVGVGAGVTRLLVRREDSDLAIRRTQVGAGVHLGWRFDVYRGLYATPWVGFDYTFNAKDVTLGDRTYANKPFTLFPAVHLGYRFR